MFYVKSLPILIVLALYCLSKSVNVLCDPHRDGLLQSHVNTTSRTGVTKAKYTVDLFAGRSTYPVFERSIHAPFGSFRIFCSTLYKYITSLACSGVNLASAIPLINACFCLLTLGSVNTFCKNEVILGFVTKS